MEFIIAVKREGKFDLIEFSGEAIHVLIDLYKLLLQLQYKSERLESYWVDRDIFKFQFLVYVLKRQYSQLLCKLIESALDCKYMFKIYRIVAKLEENKIKFWITTGKYMVKIEASKNNEENFEEYKIDVLNLYELRPGYLGLKKILEPKLLIRIKDKVVKSFDKVRDLSNFETLEELFKYLDSVYMMI